MCVCSQVYCSIVGCTTHGMFVLRSIVVLLGAPHKVCLFFGLSASLFWTALLCCRFNSHTVMVAVTSINFVHQWLLCCGGITWGHLLTLVWQIYI